MLTMLQTVERYLDLCVRVRDAAADHSEHSEGRENDTDCRFCDLLGQQKALAAVLELNVGPLEMLPLLPVEESDAHAPMPPEIHVYAVSGESDESYPDTFLLLLPPRVDGGIRDKPVAVTLSRDELAELPDVTRSALMQGSVLGAAPRVYQASQASPPPIRTARTEKTERRTRR